MKRRARFRILTWRRRSHDHDDSSDFSSWVCSKTEQIFLLLLLVLFFCWNYLRWQWCKATKRLIESQHVQNLHYSLACFQFGCHPFLPSLHFADNRKPFTEKCLIGLHSRRLFWLNIGLNYRRRELSALASSSHTSSFTLLQDAGSGYPLDLDNRLMLNKTIDCYWDRKGSIKLLIKHSRKTEFSKKDSLFNNHKNNSGDIIPEKVSCI